jgi:hypothetical protein
MAEINISNLGGGGGGTLTLTTTGTGGASTYVAGVLNIPVYQSALTNPVTGTGTATRVAFWDSASSVSSSANLYWDNSNSFLGVGTATPGARLQVNGTGLLTATAFAVKDSGGTDSFTVADNGNTSVRGVLTISGSSASNSATLMGRTSTGEVASVTLGTNLSFSGNTLNVTGGTGITSLNGLTAATQTFATGTTGTDFNISSATSTHTFNLPTASATNRGALSSADWSTFNGKQNALTNPVTGTGSSGNVTFWTGTNTVSSSSNLFWNNSTNRLAIGTTGASERLTVAGNGDFSGTFPYINLRPSASGWGVFYFQSGVNVSAGVAGDFTAYVNPANKGFSFTNNNTVRMMMSATTGDWGFGGITAPSARLDVRASGNSGVDIVNFERLDGTDVLRIGADGTITMGDGNNIVLGSTSGTKIGTATTQKIGFYNASPVVRPDTGVAEAAFVENAGGTAVNDDSTFGGYTLRQVVQALQNLGLLA